jgi:competence protein ComEA
MSLPRLRLPQVWTVSQRRVVLAIVVALLGILAIQFWLNPTDVSDPQPPHGARYDELKDRIDPNVADLSELSALPTLGEKRAKAIIDYREEFARLHPGERAFNSPRDLLKLKGFGVAMVNNLQPYLIFNPAPTTQP